MSVFTPAQQDDAYGFFHAQGFVILRGLWNDDELAAMTAECAVAQTRVARGELPGEFGDRTLSDDATTPSIVNYVHYITQLAPAVREAAHHPLIKNLIKRWIPGAYLSEKSRFGVVYQDARASRESGYSRIGWHSDWQSGPHLDRWPSVAFTIHIDGTSPANGFLRVVPKSHLWATPAPYRNVNNAAVPEGAKPWGGHTDTPPPFEMPLRFEKAPGEVGIYCEAGDILFHDAYLWHSAARATDDDAIRRHVRGGWFSGPPEPTGHFLEDFVKNAAR